MRALVRALGVGGPDLVFAEVLGRDPDADLGAGDRPPLGVDHRAVNAARLRCSRLRRLDRQLEQQGLLRDHHGDDLRTLRHIDPIRQRQSGRHPGRRELAALIGPARGTGNLPLACEDLGAGDRPIVDVDQPARDRHAPCDLERREVERLGVLSHAKSSLPGLVEVNEGFRHSDHLHADATGQAVRLELAAGVADDRHRSLERALALLGVRLLVRPVAHHDRDPGHGLARTPDANVSPDPDGLLQEDGALRRLIAPDVQADDRAGPGRQGRIDPREDLELPLGDRRDDEAAVVVGGHLGQPFGSIDDESEGVGGIGGREDDLDPPGPFRPAGHDVALDPARRAQPELLADHLGGTDLGVGCRRGR